MKSETYTTGKVIRVYPATGTCDVRLTTGGVQYSVPVMNTIGGRQSNDSSVMHDLIDATVVLLNIHSQWYVMATVPTHDTVVSGITASSTNTDSGSENQTTYGNEPNPVFDYSTGRSMSVQPGDKLISADGGAELFLGREGLAILKASPLAQFILGAFKDFGKLICREFEVFTDFGVMKFSGGGETGRTSLSIMGGAGACDEANTSDPAYTVQLFMGDDPSDPESRFSLRVTNAQRSESVEIVLDTFGKLYVRTSTDTELRVLQDLMTTVDRDEFHYVVGDQTTVIGENPNADEDAAAEEDSSKEKPEPSGIRNTVIRKDDILAVDGNSTTTIGGNREMTVSGDNTESVAGDFSEATQGEKHTEVGKSETHTVAERLTIDCGFLALLTGGLTVINKKGGASTLTVTCPPVNIVRG